MYKSKLQELCQQKKWEIPEYKSTKQGLDHNPRFQATVNVNGVSFQSQSLAKSSKDAQNDAAKLAFDHFSSSSSFSASCSPPPPPPSSAAFIGSPCASTEMNGLSSAIGTLQQLKIQETYQTPRGNGATAVFRNDDKFTGSSSVSNGVNSHLSMERMLQQLKAQETSQTPQGNGTAPITKDDDKFTDLQHMYKNQLQSYVQKRNLTLPVYSCECLGPSHASRFKCKVTVDGQTFESEEYFPTLNRAEQSAAKAALMSLSPNGVQEDESAYKNLLQELAQKESHHLPAYTTNKLGEAHRPTFVSTVEIGGESYTGQEARTKKEAEMSAAKVAYTALKQRNSRQNPAFPSPASQVQEAPQLPSRASQVQEAPQLSSSSLRSNLTAYLLQNVQPKFPVPNEKAEEEGVSDQVSSHHLRIASPRPESNSALKKVSASSDPSIFILPENETSPPCLPSVPSNSSTNMAISTAIEHLVGMSSLCQNRVFIHPRETKVKHPAGSTVLPISNENWVAAKIAPQLTQ